MDERSEGFHPTPRDIGASLTALAMGEITHALDLIATCVGVTHHARSDGSCRCGHNQPAKIDERS